MRGIKGWSTRAPAQVTIIETGEILDPVDFNTYLTVLLQDTTHLVTEWLNNDDYWELSINDDGKTKAAEMARQLRIGDYRDIPAHYSQRSRVLRLARDNWLTTVRSHNASPVGTKRKPRVAGKFVRFGAADGQLTRVRLVDSVLAWSVLLPIGWVEASFVIPPRLGVPTRGAQPTIRLDGDGVLKYSLSGDYELPEPAMGSRYIGVDLGKEIPHVAAVTSEEGKVLSLHYPAIGTTNTNRKQKTARRIVNDLYSKLAKYEALGLTGKMVSTRKEIARQKKAVSRKAANIARDTARQVVDLAREQDAVLGLEDLRWVPHNGKWQHGVTNAWVEHFARFAGVTSTTVNAAYSSRTCPKCRARNTYPTERLIRCKDCLVQMDRDDSASVEIARRTRKKTGPTPKRPKKRTEVKKPKLPAPTDSVPQGGVCSPIVGQDTSITDRQDNLAIPQPKRSKYRNYRFI